MTQNPLLTESSLPYRLPDFISHMEEGSDREVNWLDEVPGCEQASTHKGTESAARRGVNYLRIGSKSEEHARKIISGCIW